ncbi:hypothetical protein EYF80_030479 [Liparis tanakae]|uniref:Uncharacterized protein n=1 Tax=Liparis tanakae TaxID=230148 RepID=A0A4Z2H352_9TELE|nr:hypothetical protein EYF80_030479 [Liparis tanakae]
MLHKERQSGFYSVSFPFPFSCSTWPIISSRTRSEALSEGQVNCSVLGILGRIPERSALPSTTLRAACNFLLQGLEDDVLQVQIHSFLVHLNHLLRSASLLFYHYDILRTLAVDTCTHLSEDLVFFSASALLYLPPPALLGLSEAAVSFRQQCEGVDPALLLEMNQLLGQGVEQPLELGTDNSGPRSLRPRGLGRGTERRRPCRRSKDNVLERRETFADLWWLLHSGSDRTSSRLLLLDKQPQRLLILTLLVLYQGLRSNDGYRLSNSSLQAFLLEKASLRLRGARRSFSTLRRASCSLGATTGKQRARTEGRLLTDSSLGYTGMAGGGRQNTTWPTADSGRPTGEGWPPKLVWLVPARSFPLLPGLQADRDLREGQLLQGLSALLRVASPAAVDEGRYRVCRLQLNGVPGVTLRLDLAWSTSEDTV